MSSETQPKTAAEPVGQQLRRAREHLGLDLSAIADQQHLRTSIIQAIEDGDYSKVDTELFLKGYIRAYAQQVGLNGDAIIRDLDAELEPLRKERERQHEADPLVGIERKKKHKRRLARAVVILAILAAIAFAVSAYLADGDRRLPGFGADSSSEAIGGDTDPNEELGEPGPSAAPTLPAEPEDTETGVTENVEPPIGQPESAEPEAAFSQLSPPLVDEPGIDGGSPEIDAPDTPVAVSPEPEMPADDLAAASSQLRMSFNDDCWVQVTDAQGNRLASALRTQGDVLELTGEAPFSVVVGAMTALESLEFRGETVDLNNIRAVNNRAQFTLEP